MGHTEVCDPLATLSEEDARTSALRAWRERNTWNHPARSTWNHPFAGREASMLNLVQHGKFHNQKGSHVTERGAKEVTDLLHPDP